jgi:hypothetical protein
MHMHAVPKSAMESGLRVLVVSTGVEKRRPDRLVQLGCIRGRTPPTPPNNNAVGGWGGAWWLSEWSSAGMGNGAATGMVKIPHLSLSLSPPPSVNQVQSAYGKKEAARQCTMEGKQRGRSVQRPGEGLCKARSVGTIAQGRTGGGSNGLEAQVRCL